MPLSLSLVTPSRSSTFKSFKLTNVNAFSDLNKTLSLISITSGGGEKVYSHDSSTFNNYCLDGNLAILVFD